MNTHEVLKRIPGVEAGPGTLIDASGFRNVASLVKQRYLKPLNEMTDEDFDSRVVQAIRRNLRDGGELRELMLELLTELPVKGKRAN